MASETTLRPGEIKDILLREIEAADLHELDVEEVGTVLEVKDGIARIYGLRGRDMAPMHAHFARARDPISCFSISGCPIRTGSRY